MGKPAFCSLKTLPTCMEKLAGKGLWPLSYGTLMSEFQFKHYNSYHVRDNGQICHNHFEKFENMQIFFFFFFT